MEQQRIERPKNCSKCGVAFSCYTQGCWCADLPMIMPLDDPADCMCPKCLKEVIDKKIEEVNSK